jgi:hypothetical protein
MVDKESVKRHIGPVVAVFGSAAAAAIVADAGVQVQELFRPFSHVQGSAGVFLSFFSLVGVAVFFVFCYH